MRDTRVRSLGLEDPLEEATAIYSHILTWKIPWTEEPGYGPRVHKGLETTEETEYACMYLVILLEVSRC